MPLKYQEEIDKLSPDFTGYQEFENRQSYRWVFIDNDWRNFSPVYLINKDRKRNDFRGWALSFFETHQQAKNTLLYLLKDKPELYKKLGTHVAEGIINNLDGLSEMECDKRGHFNHFEYLEVDFGPRFTIVEKIAG